ncbi:hypothetical protein [Paenibacillus thalictri]|uniref:Uncharacterized protein n=1 Tax=Paenibacillus thalictri TaxID=2527873 RepID=A0A4Q9DS66_9BACL|nr:hypothetical protein [Paenibacillus thalictri]TBL79699.1 hypothetical protein EYB31_08795 [Paenibacillus thalictri]
MKLRLLPVLVTVCISAVVLFGGYFTYQSLAMENPLNKIITSAPGVQSAGMTLTSSEADIDLKLNSDANLREIVHKITTDGASILGKKELSVKVTNDSVPALDQWWSSVLFDVAQAMETKHYSDIPATLQDKAKQVNGLQTDTQMDDKNVYIRITDGTQSKFVILPRTPAKIGVWPNE